MTFLLPSSGKTTNYLLDADNILEEVDTAGNLLARYTQGLGIDEPLAMLRSGATSYYHADGLGSIASLSNTAKGIFGRLSLRRAASREKRTARNGCATKANAKRPQPGMAVPPKAK